jgi:hypothetical protein
MNPREFTKNQKVRVIYGFDGMHIKDDDVYELMQKYADLQLLQTCVSSRRELLIAFLREQNRKHHITMFDNDFEFADRLLKAINSY